MKTETVCIAAKAQYGGVPMIVFCTDLMISTDATSAEIGWKVVPLARGFTALVAGPVSLSKEAAEVFRKLITKTEMTDESALPLLRSGVGAMKHRIADRYVYSLFGKTYDWFLKSGKGSLGEEDFRFHLGEITRLDIDGIELLIFGFINEQPRIYKISVHDVFSVDTFGVIGSGTSLAESSLFHRDHAAHTSLGNALYQVYEAKKLSEKALGVGKKTYMAAIEPLDQGSVTLQIMWPSGIDHLEEQFKQFGPQSISSNLEVHPGHFAHLESYAKAP